MALQDLLDISNKKNQLGQKQGLSKERVDAQLGNIRNLIAFYREYPDIFIDQIKGPDCPFKFYFYQRIFLRIVMRHRYVYATFPRAYSKSFLSVLILMLRCVLFPGAHLFVTTGGKEQAAGIAREKAEELCKLIPGLKNEID